MCGKEAEAEQSECSYFIFHNFASSYVSMGQEFGQNLEIINITKFFPYFWFAITSSKNEINDFSDKIFIQCK